MLEIGTSLEKSLKSGATEACWLLNIYYNNDATATNVIHLSDRDRTIDGVDYIGAVKSWGTLRHKGDFFNFTSSTSTLLVEIDNTPNAIVGGRFTDLYSAKNFTNRKWELFLSDSGAVSTDPIGSGIISSDMDVDELSVQLYLLNYESKFDKKIPINTVDAATYPNAPDINLNKPIQMSFGEFDRTSTDAVLDYDRMWAKGRFPAIITSDTATVTALADSKDINTIRKRNIYTFQDNLFYAACNPSNVSAPSADGSGHILTFGGTSYFANISLNNLDTDSHRTNPLFINNEIVGGSTELRSESDGDFFTHLLYIPNSMAGLETFQNLRVKIAKATPGSVNGTATVFMGAGSAATITWDAVNQDILINTPTWPPSENIISIVIGNVADVITGILNVQEVGCEIEINTVQDYTAPIKIRSIDKDVDPYGGGTGGRYDSGESPNRESFYIDTVYSTNGGKEPEPVKAVFFAGKGRKFGSWITDSGRSTGYSPASSLRNPIYMVEEVVRSEVGLSTSDIDQTSFDAAGNTSTGSLSSVFGLSVNSIFFAFSQTEFISSLDFYKKIGEQCGTIFFISGNGKIKAAVRKRPASYTSSDKVFSCYYPDLKDISYKRTPLGQVRNDISVNYAKDYALGTFLGNATTSDATSQGNTSSGYNQVLTWEGDMSCALEPTTAEGYAAGLLAWHKDRHDLITFTTHKSSYQALEVGDVIGFIDWDPNFTVYGSTPGSNDFYMVTSVSKEGPFSTTIECMQVSD